MFDHPEFDHHESVTHFSEPRSGLQAIIAIHSTVMGPAGGGVRMFPYASPDEALTDVLRLSKGMTYKAAMSGLPFGGGKTVIIGDSHHKTEALFEALGDAIESLAGRYFCGEDVGTSPADMQVIARRTKHVVGLPGRSGDPSPATAHGVFVAMTQAALTTLGHESLAETRVAVQGVGHVGEPLVRRLVEAGAQVTVADIDRDHVAALVAELGVAAVDPTKIHMVDADIFSPCAMGASINDNTIDDLGARIICGSANNQLADERHGELLHDRGIVYVPDYVANAGGAISALRERVHYEPHEYEDRIESIGRRVHDILERSQRTGEAPSDAADSIAAELVEAARTAR